MTFDPAEVKRATLAALTAAVHDPGGGAAADIMVALNLDPGGIGTDREMFLLGVLCCTLGFYAEQIHEHEPDPEAYIRGLALFAARRMEEGL